MSDDDWASDFVRGEVCCDETHTLPLRDLEEMHHLIWG